MKTKIINMLFFAITLCGTIQSQTHNDTIKAFVMQWNTVMSEHQREKLSSLYGEKVLFYGTEYTTNQCVKAKKDFFKKNPTFLQSIDDNISIEERDGGNGAVVSFTKKVTLKGKTSIYPSYLVLMKIENKWKIITESDKITDSLLTKKMLKYDVKKFKKCEDVVKAIFLSVSEIQKKIDPYIVLDVESDGKLYTAHLYYLPHPIEEVGMTMTMGWYSFDIEKQELLDTTLGDPEETPKLQYDTTLIQYINKFCQ